MAKSPARSTDPDDLTREQELEFTDELAALPWWPGDTAFDSEEHKFRAWRQHGARLTREFVASNPGRRPPGWWRYESPGAFDSDVFDIDLPDFGAEEWRGPHGLRLQSGTARLYLGGVMTEEEFQRLDAWERTALEALEAGETPESSGHGGRGP